MLRLENIPPSEMTEVVHIASELYEKDRQQEAETQERQATVDAAAEVGLPEEYLHRAAAELHARRVARVRQQRRRRTGVLATVGVALALGTGAYVVTRPHVNPTFLPKSATVARPHTSLAFGPANWRMSANAGTQATVKYENGAAILHVQRFAADSAGHFTANLNSSSGAINLTKFRTVSFRVHGTLPRLRLYLEHGNERWRSPALAVTGQDQQVRIDLSQFERQTRADRGAEWRTFAHQAPEWVDNLSFKTGWFVNEIGVSGDIALSDADFE